MTRLELSLLKYAWLLSWEMRFKSWFRVILITPSIAYSEN
jgi:hypothetical protein